MTKSLMYPLSDGTTASMCLSGSNVVLGGNPIVIFKGKYIIDGHHRWSQTFAMNSNASMKAVDLGLQTADPVKVLAAVQMAIVAKSKKLPVQTVSAGTNLFSVSKPTLIGYVKSTIKPDVINVFNQYNISDNIDGIANYIWNNIIVMRSKSTPISGAPSRGVMPQTDEAPGWDQVLTTGRVNWNNPF